VLTKIKVQTRVEHHTDMTKANRNILQSEGRSNTDRDGILRLDYNIEDNNVYEIEKTQSQGTGFINYTGKPES